MKMSDEKAMEKNGLGEILAENGLDQDFWLKRFKEVGITNGKQLKHASRKDFNQLNHVKRYRWEENALKSCFHEVFKTSREERQEEMKRTDDQVKELLNKIEKITEEEERMARMKIDFKTLPGPRDLHKELTKTDFSATEIAVREKMTSSEIVSRISCGRILGGYYIHENAWTRVVQRKQLITIPDQVEILAPRIAETFTSKEFFSEEKSEFYDHVVHHWGLSAAVSGGLIGTFTGDISFSLKKTDDETRRNVSHKGYTEIKETVYVPIASFCLEKVPHFISCNALEELKILEEKLSRENSSDLCREFFENFGSHYFAGTYHFGGCYTRSVVCRSESAMTKADTIKLCKGALKGGGSGMTSWCFGARLDAEKSNDESRRKFQEDVDYNVEKKIVKRGGPAEVDDISQWKLGLVKYPNTWAVIDQDVHKEEWKGVWELLKDEHTTHFSNIEHLQSTLKKEWENEFKESMFLKNLFSTLQQEWEEKLKESKSHPYDPFLPLLEKIPSTTIGQLLPTTNQYPLTQTSHFPPRNKLHSRKILGDATKTQKWRGDRSWIGPQYKKA